MKEKMQNLRRLVENFFVANFKSVPSARIDGETGALLWGDLEVSHEDGEYILYRKVHYPATRNDPPDVDVVQIGNSPCESVIFRLLIEVYVKDVVAVFLENDFLEKQEVVSPGQGAEP